MPAMQTFLSDLRHEAHQTLPADRAEQTVAEVESHLAENVNALVAQGEATETAEQHAVARFDTPRRFIRTIESSQHETRLSRRARNGSFMVTVLLTMALLTYFVYGGGAFLAEVLQTMGLVALIPFSGALLARQRQTRRYLLCATVALALALVSAGGVLFSTNPETAAMTYAAIRHQISIPGLQVNLSSSLQAHEVVAERLQAATRSYAVGGDTKAPGLYWREKYVCPTSHTPIEQSPLLFAAMLRLPESSKTLNVSKHLLDKAFKAAVQNGSIQLTADRAVAAQLWQKGGANGWITTNHRNVAYLRRTLDWLNNGAKEAFGLAFASLTGCALFLWIGIVLLPADAVGARLGRKIWYRWQDAQQRRTRRGQSATQ